MSIDTRYLSPPTYRLGSGEFGRVFESQYEGKKVVMKIMKHAISTEIFLNEIDILKHLEHPNIPRFIGFSIKKDRDFRCIVYEKAEGIDLLQFIHYRDVPDPQKQEISYQVITTLAYIHSKNVIYCDLKPENVIVNTRTGQIKLIDFGLSRRSKSPIRGLAGTPGYIAPEVVKDNYYWFTADIYSYGILFFVLWTERNPVKRSIMIRVITNLPKNLQRIILSCTSEDPSARPTCSEIITLLYQKPSCLDKIRMCVL